MVLIAACVAATPAAARTLSLIRDAEIEDTIRAYTTPLFAAAGLDAEAVEVHIVNSRDLNAFVAGGQKIFIFTGLLQASTSPSQIIGVLAHETGHILGGHLARTQDALRSASNQAILAMVLGAAAIVAGQGQAGSAVIAGGQQLAQRGLLSYSRTQESAADQAALRLLDATGQSARGIAEFLEILGDQEALLPESQDPYVLTHPMTRERIAAVQRHLVVSPHSEVQDPPEFETRHVRMLAKLQGFLRRPKHTLRRYPVADQTFAARYARAIAYQQIPKITEALAEIDGLIAEHPDDPYLHELRGDILLSNTHIAEAISAYERAVALHPNSPLLLLGLGRAEVASEDSARAASAIEHLEKSARLDPGNVSTWRHLAIGYGRGGDLGRSALASAEENFLRGRHELARRHAEQAERRLPQGSPAWLKAQDILSATEKAVNTRQQ